MYRESSIELTVLSPAKVNLFLKVLSRRSDGYHNIVSVVDLISLYDILRIKEEPGELVTVKDDRRVLPEGRQNTMYRAAMLLRETFGISAGINICVDKHIPIGSGLGGPSSNAAAVLKALVSLWNLSISTKKLMDLGRKIGADVPLFLYGRSCVMRGIGERITPISLPSIWYVIVYPDSSLSTSEVYSRLRISLTKGENDIKLRSGFQATTEIAALLENDLEQVGVLMCPEIQAIKDRMIQRGAVGTMMSGSGSSVFGLFETEQEAEKASAFFRDMGSVFVAHSI